MCRAASELDYTESNLVWTEYFERHYSFFSMMLASKGAPYFRDRFLDFLTEEFTNDIEVSKGKNEGLDEDLHVRFVASAYVGVVEWWFTNEKPVPHHVLPEKLATCIDRIVHS